MGQFCATLVVTRNETIAENVKTPIDDLPLLTNAIDPDALAVLVPADPASDVTITFTHAGQRVRVHAGHTVYVQPITEGK